MSYRSIRLNDAVVEEAQRLRDWVKARPSLPAVLRRCQDVCASLIEGKVGIPARFNRADFSESELHTCVSNACRDRDSILQLSIVRLLTDVAPSKPSQAASLGPLQTLIQHLARDTNPPPPGLLPDRSHGNSGAPGGYAGSTAAKTFFEKQLTAVLHNIDHVHGTKLSASVPLPYVPQDAISVAAWGRTWTLATAAIATDWLSRQGRGLIDGALQALQTGSVPQFRTLRGPLPSGEKTLRLELWASPFLCQVLKHNPKLDWPTTGTSPHCVNHFWMGELTSEQVRGDSFATGRSVGHLYLSVWLERAAPLLGQLTNTGAMTNTTNLPDSLALNVPQGQHPTVSVLIKQFAEPEPIQQNNTKTWFAKTSMHIRAQREQAAPSANQSQAAGDPESAVRPLKRGWLNQKRAPRHFTDCIGGISLPWDTVSKPDIAAQWIDIFCIVRHDQTWHALPITMIDDADGEDAVWLTVDTAYLAVPFEVEALRAGFDTARWVYRQDGLGVFIAASLDLDGPLPSK